jgi:hypothetical protein
MKFSGLWKDDRNGRTTHNELTIRTPDISCGLRSPDWAAIPARTASNKGKLLIDTDAPGRADIPAGRGAGGNGAGRDSRTNADLGRGDVAADEQRSLFMAAPKSGEYLAAVKAEYLKAL